MILFSRTDSSVFGRWWWTVDRWLLAAIGILIMFGGFLVMTASPAVADRINVGSNYFTLRHLMFLIPGLLLMFGVSLFTPRQTLLFAALMFAGSMVALALTMVIGVEIKGARRWIHLLGMSIQPSEFVKPAFIVLNAWLLSSPRIRSGGLLRILPVILLSSVVGLLLCQPDMGMTTLVTFVWAGQLFLAGLPIIFVAGILGLSVVGAIGAYFAFAHVASRIDRFMNPDVGDTYQVERALDAFQNGGMFGTGLGQGTVKEQIPDAHADFIFAVAGEELGLLLCLVLLGTIAFIVLRGLWRSTQGPTLFVTLASAGLVMQFAVQSLVNIGSSLHLLPTKGMTLPFVSYGGSSMIAMALGMGMLIALTRRRTHTP